MNKQMVECHLFIYLYPSKPISSYAIETVSSFFTQNDYLYNLRERFHPKQKLFILFLI